MILFTLKNKNHGIKIWHNNSGKESLYMISIGSSNEATREPISDLLPSFLEGDFVCFKDILYLFAYSNGASISPVSFKFDLMANSNEKISISIPKLIKKALVVALLDEKPIICMSGGRIDEKLTRNSSVFFPDQNEIKEGSKLTTARSHHCWVQFSNAYLYVFGGYYYEGNELTPWTIIESISIQNFVDGSQKWNSISISSGEKIMWIEATAVNFGKRILIFGGRNI
jgi:hypothetical protein